MKRLASICARGGSKGVPNKNLRIVAGKPLLAYSILQAKATRIFDKVVVGSDSDEILHIARRFGADGTFKRPMELASDHAPKMPAIIHCVESAEVFFQSKFEIFVDLDCTSPLRSVQDIIGTVELLEATNSSNVITGSRARRSPYFNLIETDQSGFVHLSKTPSIPFFRRQDAPNCYDMNASIYAWKRDALLERKTIFQSQTRLFEMDEDHSWDIDSELDFEFVSFLISRRSDLLRL